MGHDEGLYVINTASVCSGSNSSCVQGWSLYGCFYLCATDTVVCEKTARPVFVCSVFDPLGDFFLSLEQLVRRGWRKRADTRPSKECGREDHLHHHHHRLTISASVPVCHLLSVQPPPTHTHTHTHTHRVWLWVWESVRPSVRQDGDEEESN